MYSDFRPYTRHAHADHCWDPEEVLKLSNTEYGCGITCVAEAKTYGRRCRRHLAASRSFSERYGELFRLPPQDAAGSAYLYLLAESLSCWQHKGQVGEIVRKWQSRLRNINQGIRLDAASRLKEMQAEVGKMSAKVDELNEKLRWYEQQSAGGPYFNSRSFSDEAARNRARDKRRKAEEEARKEEELRYQRQEAQRKEKEKATQQAKAREEEIKARARRRAEQREAAERRQWAEAWSRYCSAWDDIDAVENREQKVRIATLDIRSYGEYELTLEIRVLKMTSPGPPNPVNGPMQQKQMCACSSNEESPLVCPTSQKKKCSVSCLGKIRDGTRIRSSNDLRVRYLTRRPEVILIG